MDAIKAVVKEVKAITKNNKKFALSPRIIPIPKQDFLPLILIFTGFSALGALAGRASYIPKVAIESFSAKQHLKEAQRPNQAEAMALCSEKDVC